MNRKATSKGHITGFIHILVMTFAVLSGIVRSHAGNIELTQRKYLYTLTSSSLWAQVIDPELVNIQALTNTFKDKKSVGYVQLGINPDSRWCYDTNYRKIIVTFSIDYKRFNYITNTTTTHTDLQSLEISFDAVNRQVYTEKARIIYDNFVYDMKATVGTITMQDRAGTTVWSGTAYSTLPQDLYFEVGLQAERYFNFTYTASPTGFQVVSVPASDEIKFQWAPMAGAEYYEVEFLHVNDYATSSLGAALTTAQIPITFHHNASRIRTTDTKYIIPNIFERGYVVARVRGIGIGGPNLDKEIPGAWLYENTPAATPYLLSTVNTNYFLQVSRHESSGGNNKNWKLSVSFAEDGKHKEIVEYADGSSRVRQSVTKLSSTQEAIVGETAYDYQGRPTVQILPVPVNSATMKYYDNFNKEDVSGSKFSRVHFDNDAVFSSSSCIPTPPRLSTTSGSSHYYSTANTVQTTQQAFVPDAEKYPYTQVVYTQDNTGRIKMQSGVGASHILGSGHETKYYYGKPLQEELDRLFGTNVGNQSHYQKNMVVDANGQVSISYLDMSGKTIATALAGQPPANVDPLKNESGGNLYVSAAETLTVNLLGDITPTFPNGEDNHLSNDGLVWSNVTPLLVENAGYYKFTYTADIKDYLDECLTSVCFDCVYDLQIDILNSCGQSVFSEDGAPNPYIIRLGGSTIDWECNEADNFSENYSSDPRFNQLLQVGNYTIVKTLKLNEDAINLYTDKYIEENSCLLKRSDFFHMPDTDGCFYSCQECLDALGTEAAFITQYSSLMPGITVAELQELYATKKAACDKICDDSDNNLCMSGYRSMLRDMNPSGGQYASTDGSDPLSIFLGTSLLPNYLGNSGSNYAPQSDAWRHPYFYDKDNSSVYALPMGTPNSALQFYFDENGQPSRIYLDQDFYGNYVPAILPTATVMTDANGAKYVYPQDLQYKEDFISRFQESWARSLVIYHPEFPFLLKCIDYSDDNVTIGSTTYEDIWEYEKYLKAFDVTNTTMMADMFPTGSALDAFELSTNDPFFMSYGSSNLLPLGPTVNAFYTGMRDNYATFPTETLTIWEEAYVTSSCPVSNPGFTATPGTTCGGGPPLNSSSGNDVYITDDQRWDRLVGSYLSIRQDIFFKKIMIDLALSSPAVVNRCMGANGYDAVNGLHSVHPWLPCDLVQYLNYAHKQARFGTPDMIYNDGPFDPAPPTADQLMAYGQQQIYAQTGLCPAAIDLQTLIYGLELESRLNTVYSSFDNEEYLMLTLRQKLDAFYSGTTPNQYSASITGQTLTTDIYLGSITPTSPKFTLTLPAGYSWSNVQSFANIDDVVFSAGTYSFTIQAQVLNTLTSALDWVELSGTTNIQIGNCSSEIPKICTTTQDAKDVKILLGQLKQNGVLGSATTNLNIDLNVAPYNTLITPIITGYIGSGGSYWWQSNAGSGIGKIVNTSNSKYIQLTVTSGLSDFQSTTPYTLYTVSSTVTTSTTTTSNNTFTMGGFTDPNDAMLGIAPDKNFGGTMVFYNGTSSVSFPVANCELPPPGDCETDAHDNWFELKEKFELNQVSSTCASNLKKLDGTSYTLPGSYTLISLKPDMDFSTDLITSTHFIALIQPLPTPSTPVYVKGEYCKPIRECATCEEDCDQMYYLVDLDADIAGLNACCSTWANAGTNFIFSVPSTLSNCFPGLVNTTYTLPTSLSPTDPATMPAILTAWAAALNASSNGTYTVTYVNSNKLLFVLSGMSHNGCICTTSVAGYMSIRQGNSVFLGHDLVPVCCNSGQTVLNPPPASGPWQTQPTLTLGDDCHPNFTPFPPQLPTSNPCVEALLAAANLNADNAYQNYLDSVRAAFRSNYISQCMNITEDFQMEFYNMQYHFTLYYYDQAGNLIKTVPPRAVKPIKFVDLVNVTAARNSSGTYLADHDKDGFSEEELSTKYVYNTLNQPRYQLTPDGGRTEFIYDPLGRLALSQNAKQKANSKNSYTLYDPLGRISEVGEMNPTSLISQSSALMYGALATWLALTVSTRAEITTTYYDNPYTGSASIVQANLRNRVSYTTYRDLQSSSVRTATYYSYDIHGNVNTFWQENKDVPITAHQIKRMDYTYDLVSGKVNTATYQSGQQDQWIHRYSYDADNRLTLVQTSRDNVFYDRDAAYFYYKHGPLARTELGNNTVQGVDYSYTIHGWLKGINTTNLDKTKDMGKDGVTGAGAIHEYFAKDAMSYALHYYTNDYKNISNNTSSIGNVSAISTSNPGYRNLYNGNISMMQTTIYDNTSAVDALLSMYRYDQLNRITFASYTAPGALTLSTNTWTNSFATRYFNTFSYDANGNIKTQFRNGKTGLESMDDLTYSYIPNTNQLSYVKDMGTAGNYTDDLESQSAGGNYTYDAIGNLITDAAEQIQAINWTVYGKVKSVTRTSGSPKDNIEFTYGPGGQRVTKKVTKSGGVVESYFYTYDASGNMMSIYKHLSTSSSDLNVEEQMLYGSSRLGSVILSEKLVAPPSGTIIYTQKRGQKRYELNNHLGNVLTVVSDRKKFNCTTSDYDPDIINTWDYSPFGAILPGRHYGNSKCVVYTINTLFTVFSDNFTGTTVNLTTAPSPATLQYYELNASTNASIGSGVMKIAGTGNPRGIAKKFSVINGKSYHVTFKHFRNTCTSSTGVTYTWRIVNDITNAVVATYTFTPGASWASVTQNNAFTATVTGTYRIEFLRSGNTTNCEFQLDDIAITYNDNVNHTVCIAETNYRFGFNGKEKDNEVSGEGNHYDYGFRVYDPRLGRFLSVDPLCKSFPWYTPYQFAGNKPITCIDLDGLEEFNVTIYVNRETGTATTRIEIVGDTGPLKVNYKINDGAHQSIYTLNAFGTKDQSDRAAQILESFRNPRKVEGGTNRLVAITYKTQFDLENKSIPGDLDLKGDEPGGGAAGSSTGPDPYKKGNSRNTPGSTAIQPHTHSLIKKDNLVKDPDVKFIMYTAKFEVGNTWTLNNQIKDIVDYYKQNPSSFEITVEVGFSLAPGATLQTKNPFATGYDTYQQIYDARKDLVKRALIKAGIPEGKISMKGTDHKHDKVLFDYK